MMIAPESEVRPAPETVKLPGSSAAIELDETPNPARVLADLYRRCAPNGGCPYSLNQVIQVLVALGGRGAVVATDIAGELQLPASAVYGCVLELEDLGLCRWIPEPVTSAEHITAEITAHGLRFLREINTAPVGERYAS